MERVFVYFNLHKKLWSVKSLKTGRVIAHSEKVLLRDCKFKVSQAGRRRVLLERKKNIHAGVVGTLVSIKDSYGLVNFETAQYVTYNPYKYETFVNIENEQPVSQSETVWMVASQGKTYVVACQNETGEVSI